LSGAIIEMENGDWRKFAELLDAKINPIIDNVNEIKKIIDKFPCAEIAVRLTKLEVKGKLHEEEVARVLAKETQAKNEARSSHDWWVKIGLAVIALLTFLQTIGFFQRLTKGE